MGDRANIALKFEDHATPIFIYSHWDGPTMALRVKTALSRRQRWEDDSYLARIIATEVLAPTIGKETGYGLALAPPDNEYPYVWVMLNEQKVRIGEHTWTFEEYIKQSDNTLLRAMHGPAERDREVTI